jgi:hypothetical protein
MARAFTPGEGDRKKKKKRRQKDQHFMDAALDAFIRSHALQLWRDFEVYRAKPGSTTASALTETGFFGDKEGYAALWQGHWERTVLTAAALPEQHLYSQFEAAVRAAVTEERQQRHERGDTAFEDLDEYNSFIRRALNSLLAEDPADRERTP